MFDEVAVIDRVKDIVKSDYPYFLNAAINTRLKIIDRFIDLTNDGDRPLLIVNSIYPAPPFEVYSKTTFQMEGQLLMERYYTFGANCSIEHNNEDNLAVSLSKALFGTVNIEATLYDNCDDAIMGIKLFL